MMEMYEFVIEPLSTWTWGQTAVFPWLFIIPAELLALIIDGMIWMGSSKPGLPSTPQEKREPLNSTDYLYCYFNRLVMLPLVAFLNIRMIAASSAVEYDFAKLSVFNTVFAFVVIFALADLVYYTGHRIVHRYPALYSVVHKHHHRESSPQRGWFDTSNAHPTDFFYTGFSTSPISVLWLMPNNFVHIGTIALLLYVNMFVGALGHSRLDINIWIFNTRFHAGHHAISRCNFAQNLEMWDRLFGTYRDLNMKKPNSCLPKGVKAE